MSDPMAVQRVLVEDALRRAQDAGGARGRTTEPDGFDDTLKDLIRETDELQKDSEQVLDDFTSGKVEDVHQVMVAMSRADLSFRMMLEVRNKLVEAYQEVMRAQV